MIEFQGVSKVFAGHPAVKDLTLGAARRRFLGAGGDFRLGQVDDAEDDQPSAGAGPGHHSLCRRGHSPAAGPDPAAADGLCHPVHRPVSPLDGGAEYRHRAAVAKDGRGQGSPTGSTS